MTEPWCRLCMILNPSCVSHQPPKSRWTQGKGESCLDVKVSTLVLDRPAIPHAFRVRLQQLPSLMRDTRLRLLPYFQDIFTLITPYLYIGMLSLTKNCPNLNFHCPICQSHSIALLPGWQVWSWILPTLPC